MKSLTIAVSLLMSTANTAAFGQIIVGHRGASFDAPENTLAAFRLAWQQNADGIEGDFYVTKDQQIVCIHDADTKRTGGEKLVVANSTLAELRKLEYGSWKDPQFRGEPIPTFAEVLAVVPPGKRLVIELKTGPEIVPYLKAELERLQPDPKYLMIIAFNQATVAACKKSLPAIKVHWLVSYKEDKQTAVWHPTFDEVVVGLRASMADGIGTQGNRDIVTSEFIEKLRSQGLREFHVWTVDLPDDACYFQKLGAFGITTNRPAFIREHLKGYVAELSPELRTYVEVRVAEFDQIPADRKAVLMQLTNCLRDAAPTANDPIKLTFICTHNSRRSHTSQLWGAVAAIYFRRNGIESYSGGTEATAFDLRAVAALKRAGFKIQVEQEDTNPRYTVRYAEGLSPWVCFSKKYDAAPNPRAGYVAVMTCTQADASCPTVPGATDRISIPFEDPKDSDGSPQESATYDARCAQIAREILFAFSVAQNCGS